MKFFFEKIEYQYSLRRCITSRDYPPHFHEHIEILINREGSFDAVCDGKSYHVSTGSVFIALPNQIHSFSNSIIGPSITLMFKPEFLGEYGKCFTGKVAESAVIEKEDLPVGVPALIELIIDYIHLSRSNPDDRIVFGYLTALMGLLNTRLDIHKRSANANLSTFQAIINYCGENYTSPISLYSVATTLGFSPNYISNLFSANISCGFKQYINTLRVNNACDMLIRSDMPITQIAFESGYSNLRTFNRTFLEICKMSPKKYRQAYREEIPVRQQELQEIKVNG